MNQEAGGLGFFECGFEGFYEVVGQFSDKADCVGQEENLVVWKLDFAGCGVEGSEKFVFLEDSSVSEGVQERRFSGIGVADDGGLGYGFGGALPALIGANLADVFEISLQAVDLAADETAVDF